MTVVALRLAAWHTARPTRRPFADITGVMSLDVGGTGGRATLLSAGGASGKGDLV